MTTSSASRGRHPYRVPLLLAGSTVLGLASGLFGDGLWDILSAAELGLPLLVLIGSLARR